MSISNGVSIEQLGEAVESITKNPDAGQFQFRARTEWTDSLQCVTKINDFDQAGKTITTQEFIIEGDEPE
jgi:hypothetical protein